MTSARGLTGSLTGLGVGLGTGALAPPDDARGGSDGTAGARPPTTQTAKITLPFDDNRMVVRLLGGVGAVAEPRRGLPVGVVQQHEPAVAQ